MSSGHVGVVSWARKRKIARRVVIVTVVFSMWSTMLVSPASGVGAGDLDQSFGIGGTTFIDFGYVELGGASTLDSQGRVIVAGSVNDASTASSDLAVARLLTDGSLDPSFSDDGLATFDVGPGEAATAVALTPDGKILIAGRLNTGSHSSGDWMFVRLHDDGTLDSSFGTGGVFHQDFGKNEMVHALVVQPDGKFIAASQANLVKYGANGAIDTSFGIAGFGATGDVVNASSIVIRPDGKILVSGDGPGTQIVVSLINIDGTLDTSFGVSGNATSNFGGGTTSSDLALQSDGKILASTRVNFDAYNLDFGLVRFNADGSIDSGFGSAGHVSAHFDVGNFLPKIAVHADGKIIVGGQAVGVYTSTADIGLVQYNPDGSLDTTFGTGGAARINLGRIEFAENLLLQADGKVIVTGIQTCCTSRADADLMVARFLASSDSTPPVVTGVADRAPDSNGWYNEPVVIDWQATDDSGTATDPANTTADLEGAAVIYGSGASCDASGNCATGTATISLDLTDPTIAGTPTPSPNVAGWNNTPVTVNFNCTDALSGIASCTPPITLTTDGLNQSAVGTAIDIAGRSTTVDVSGINIDQTPPSVTSTTFSANPKSLSSSSTLTAQLSDNLSGIAAAEYSIGGGTGIPMTLSGSTATAIFDNSIADGVYQIDVRAQDAAGNWSATSSVYLVVYNPDGGFVTGGGWIDSPAAAYGNDPTLTGRASFGFVSRYKKGAETPSGNTEFRFNLANLDFQSTSYDWLVVTGNDSANFKGSGTINGTGNYQFRLWAGDNEPDTFRIKIWTEDELGTESVLYDNGSGQAIGGGNIVVHTKNR